jgi:transcriptional regulator with XRE-family HTH domain
MPVSGPTVARRQLGRRLKGFREAAGVTVEQIVAANLASRTKIWRIEGGQVRVSVPDVWALCRFYGVDQADTDALTALAEHTSDHGLWHEYRDVVPDWFKLYIGLEAAASRIHTFEDSVVPGELQTADYAQALWHGAWPELVQQDIEPHVSLRLRRQQALLDQATPRKLTVVLGENVLRRQVGGPDVMAAQVQHLNRLAEAGTVDIRVLPFAAGAHPATTGAFRILDFTDDEDPDIVYVELEVGAHYLEKPDQLAQYRRIFARLTERAVPMGELPA